MEARNFEYQEKETKVPFLEKLSFGSYVGAQNIFYHFITSYLMIFYTDVFGISALAIGTLFFVARMWDAFNDPVMGMIVNKSQFKSGKYKPFLKWSPIFIAIFTILCFYAPDLSPSNKLIYAYITYIGWGMVYTICDVPMWSMTAVMTDDTKERVSIISLSQVFVTLAQIVIAIGAIPLVLIIGQGDMKKGYFFTGVILAVTSALIMMITSRHITERVKAINDEAVKLSETISYFFKNKPLLVITLGRCFGILSLVPSLLSVYFVKYNLGNIALLPVFGALAIPFSTFGFFLASKLVKRFEKKIS